MVLVAIGELGELLGRWFSFPSQRCPLLLFCFSSPSLVLLALAALMVAG
jgi:hypothetical protein